MSRHSAIAGDKADVIYINSTLGEAGVLSSSDPSRVVLAQTYVTRSGAVVERAEDYYCSVFRLSFSTNASVPLWIPRMVVPSVDGITLENTVTLRAIIGGVTFRGRANLQLQIEPADRILWQEQPDSVYAFVWDTARFVAILNDALDRAYTALLAAGAALAAGERPFVNYNEAGYMSMTAYPFNLWAKPFAGADRCEIFFNRESAAILDGWLLYYFTDPATNDPPDPNGEDILLELVNTGRNYDPPPVGGFAGPAPAAPATSSITMLQSNKTVFPGISTIRLLSSLPAAPEFVPSVNGASTAAILTDFRPDPTEVGSEIEIYNAAFGSARWIKLRGPQPITHFTLQLQTVDWMGKVRPLVLVANGQEATVKLCFAPRRLVENWKS